MGGGGSPRHLAVSPTPKPNMRGVDLDHGDRVRHCQIPVGAPSSWASTFASAPLTTDAPMQRSPFPASWPGLAGEQLPAVCGFPDARCCRPGAFIAGFGSERPAIADAALPLECAAPSSSPCNALTAP